MLAYYSPISCEENTLPFKDYSKASSSDMNRNDSHGNTPMGILEENSRVTKVTHQLWYLIQSHSQRHVTYDITGHN